MSERAQTGGLLRGAWEHWQQLARAIGVVQTRLLMIAFYFVFVLPTGIFARMSGDKLHLQRPSGSCWVPHPPSEQNIESARRQF